MFKALLTIYIANIVDILLLGGINMKLKQLLNNINYELIQGSDETEIKNISWDSRNVGEDSLFICVKGKNVDRHDYALTAVEKGALALVIQHEVENIPEGITVIKVEDSQASMAVIASEFYNHPSRKFNLVGITGTNGKTSTSYFVSEILESLGKNVGVIGTIENKINL